MKQDGPSTRDLARLRDRARRALGEQTVRAIIGPGQIPASEAAAQSAWNKLRDGDAPTPDELQALELVIRMMRPAPLSIGGRLEDLPDHEGHHLYPPDLKDAWATFRTLVRPLPTPPTATRPALRRSWSLLLAGPEGTRCAAP